MVINFNHIPPLNNKNFTPDAGDMTGYTEDRLVRDNVAMAMGTEATQNGMEDYQAELDRATVQDGADLDAVSNDEGVVVVEAQDDEEDEDVFMTVALYDVSN